MLKTGKRQTYILQSEDPLIEFYKARVTYFYNGLVEKTDFDSLDGVIRNTTNRQVAMKTNFKILDMMHHDHISPSKPMAAFGANHFQV